MRGPWILLVLLLGMGGSPSSPSSASSASSAPAAPPRSIPDIETFMQIGAASSPILSRDGETLFFTSSMTGTRQLYRLTPEGWPYQLTFFPNGVGGINTSRDDRTIGVTAAPEGNERYRIYLLDARTGLITQEIGDPRARFGTPGFSPDGTRIFFSGNPDSPTDFHVYEQDLASGARRTVYDREGLNTLVDVSEDGRLLLVSHSNSNSDNDLYAVDVASGDARLLTPHEGGILFTAAFFLGDPGIVYVVSDEDGDGIARLAKIQGDPPRRTPLFPQERAAWSVESAAISPDFHTLAWIVNEDGWGRLHLWDLVHDRALPVPDLDGIVASVSLSERPRIAFAYTSPLQTFDVWTWDWEERGGPSEAGGLRRRTFSTYAGIDPDWFTPPELIHYRSFDGMEIPAFLYMPPAADGRAVPFVIDVHGGPEGQFRPVFNRHFQYLLLNGYGIFAPNVRGSAGYGRAYLQADDYTKRLDSVKDLAWGAKYLIESGRAEPGRIGIKGASYGGFMTLAAMTEFPDYFAAGVDEVGIANFETFLAGTAAYRRDLRASEYGPPSDSLFLRSISPIHKVDRIRGALLVVHGENDPRVPIGEARQIIHALRGRGAPVDSLIFPDEGHSVSKLSNRLILYRRMAEFFDRYLKGTGDPRRSPSSAPGATTPKQ